MPVLVKSDLAIRFRVKKTKIEKFGPSGSSLEFPKDPLLFDFQPRKNAIGQGKIHRPNLVLE